MGRPDITVIIGAYNAMPYLTKTLTSVVEQSIGHDRLEIIAVDDGSTDDTGIELKRFASLYPQLLTVIHQENSGGPSKPRNVGLDHAQGRFVFFLDADDYLGPEALERMLAAAEKNRTDVVLGKMVGVNGRSAPASMFVRNQPRTDVFSSRVYWALNPLKLIRRELIKRHSLRFPTGYQVCEDQEFTALAYLHADGISVVADYECLYILRRDDGGNITTVTRGAGQRIKALRRMVDLVEEHTAPGPDRDALMHRHLSIDMTNALYHLPHETDQALVREQFGELRELVERVCTDTLVQRLGAVNRLRCELIRRGLLDELIELEQAVGAAQSRPDLVTEDGRAFAALPFFRDEDRGIPDHFYDVTRELQTRHRLDAVQLDGNLLNLSGHAYLRHLTTERTSATLLLRERDSKAEHRFPMATVDTPGLGADEDDGLTYDQAGFYVSVDLTKADACDRLPDGLWDIFVVIDHGGLTKEIRFGNNRLPEIPSKPRTYLLEDTTGSLTPGTLYYTNPYDNLTLDLGENKHRFDGKIRVERIRATSDPMALVIRGVHALAQSPAQHLKARLVDAHGNNTSVAAATSQSNRFEATLPLSHLAAGTYSVTLRLGDNGPQGRNIPLMTQPLESVLRWTRFGFPWYAKINQNTEGLHIQVERVSITKGLTRRLTTRN
ncbi:glycosyltransferase [Streptomyces sp. ISL-100]|uniref:glycosyltransferase n=1 Tax=Streptomyces sp. ISL-100 TaxID=2819173 RepID=UPI001BE57A66|nr:glycosyltransferase [Streptomyces sp. ISL-100]MBT2398751.1 glycosyltransferase [Streptomyces sp. ISL-100]